MRLLRRRRFRLILLLPLSFVLTRLAAGFPHLTERWYSRRVYPFLSGLGGAFTSLFPFSLAELLLCSGAVLLPVLLVLAVRKLLLEKHRRLSLLLSWGAGLLACAGVICFFFTVTCGLNYHRQTFAAQSGLVIRDSSAQELAALCEELTAEANRLRPLVEEDSQGVMRSSFSAWREAAPYCSLGYQALSRDYPVLGGYTPAPKPVLLSRGMSYLNIVGIYIPFTFEPNINTDVPHYSIPSSMMHEIAHYKGFMREDEANFISYLACRATGHADFAYSGTLLALIHSSNALYSANRDYYNQVMAGLDEGVYRDFAANRAYWKQFEGPVAEVSTAVNDVYLKTNSQESGVKSYGRMVDLLLADYRARYNLV